MVDNVAIHPHETMADLARFVNFEFEKFGLTGADWGCEGPGQDVGGVGGGVVGVCDGEPDGGVDVFDAGTGFERGRADEAGFEDAVGVFDEVGAGLVECDVEVGAVTDEVEFSLLGWGLAKEARGFAYEEVREDVADYLEPVEF